MKGLLQSKRFRKNLGKWLFMYAGVMLLLTTVVTYSKYMTGLQSSSQTSAARFELAINCTSSNGKECEKDIEAYEVTKEGLEFTYVFTVDASNMDVKSKLKLFTFVDESFSVENISREYKECVETDTTQCPKNLDSTTYILEPIELPGGLEEPTFEIKVKYTGSLDDLSEEVDNPTVKDVVVVVGYAIEQIR